MKNVNNGGAVLLVHCCYCWYHEWRWAENGTIENATCTISKEYFGIKECCRCFYINNNNCRGAVANEVLRGFKRAAPYVHQTLQAFLCVHYQPHLIHLNDRATFRYLGVSPKRTLQILARLDCLQLNSLQMALTRTLHNSDPQYTNLVRTVCNSNVWRLLTDLKH